MVGLVKLSPLLFQGFRVIERSIRDADTGVSDDREEETRRQRADDSGRDDDCGLAEQTGDAV
jgi:hypothetical protein